MILSSAAIRGASVVLGAILLFAAGLFFIVWLFDTPENILAKKRAKCDEAVTALLYSKEQVEVIRAGILVRQLDCSIGRRLLSTGAIP